MWVCLTLSGYGAFDNLGRLFPPSGGKTVAESVAQELASSVPVLTARRGAAATQRGGRSIAPAVGSKLETRQQCGCPGEPVAAGCLERSATQ